MKCIKFIISSVIFVMFILSMNEKCYGQEEDATVVSPMEKAEQEALYSTIQGFVGNSWNGSDLFPDPCGSTSIEGVSCDIFNGLWYVTVINIGPIHENSLPCANEKLEFKPELFQLKYLKAISFFNCFQSPNKLPVSIPTGNWEKLAESLESIEFRSNPGLVGNIPSTFGVLKNLQSLVLLENGLTGNIPQEIGNLVKLKRLVLSGNNFSGNIPDMFGGLSDLLILDLSRNSLSGTLPVTLGRLISVLKLDLSHNFLEGKLLNEFGNLKNLTLMDLRNNRLCCGLVLSLQEMNSLEEMVLSNNPLGGDIRSLKWENLQNLVILELSNMELIGEIPESLSELKKLRFLGLSDNNITGAKMERPKVRPVEFIAAITNKKDFWKLAVRVKDKWTVVKDGKEHLELIIVDAKGNDIQLVIPTGYKAVCDKVLLENTTYTLSNFQVQKNDDAFKASDHKYKLIWTGGTNADNVNVHDIPNPSIKFKPFSEIVSGKWRADLLVHVIGIVHEMRYCQLNEGTGKKLQVNFGLKDLSDISVNCTLWEDYAAKFIKFNKDRKEGGPVIVMLNYCKIKEEGRFPLSVSNTYSFTKLSINENIPEINLFRESLPKDEQLMSSSQIQCSQSYGNTQVATEDDLLSNSQILPLSQVIQLDVISYCVTVAKIEKVNSTKNGWYYFACHKCPKIAKGDKPPYTCDDGHNTETEIVRYKLEMDVSYDMDRTVFVVWDREVTQMLGISAAQLRSNMIQAGITNRFEFPTIMDDLAEKTMVFKVKWQPRWKSCSVVCYKEGEAFTDRVRAKFPNLVEAEPEIENLGADVMMDNTNPNPAASNEDVTISTHDLSASSEYDPDGLTQITPISGLKNAGQPMSCESLSQLTPGSFNSVAEKVNARPTVEITPHKMAATDDFCNAGGHNEITPAKQTSSKRVKLIKQEKK